MISNAKPLNGRVLVLGDDPSVCLAVVRSLGRRGLTVSLGTQDNTSIVERSRYLSGVIVFPPIASGSQPWCDKLAGILQQQKYDLIIPVADGCLVPVMQQRARFEALAKFAIPDELGFQTTYLKQNTIAMAQRLEVPVPRTALVCNIADLKDMESRAEMSLPLVIKPVSSKVWRGGRRIDNFVSVEHDWEKVRDRVQELLKITPVLIQSYFQGIGVGQEFLVDNGVILSAFQHERLHEPMEGGGSLYRKSVPLDGDMLKHSARMLDDMTWTGVAMVEYKRDPVSGNFALMEINGRFWGSLPLAISAGVDFPADLYGLLVEGKKPKATSYRYGVYCRKAPQDVLWFVENWRADRGNPCLMTVPKSRATVEWLNVLRGREHWDSLTLDDPMPGLADWAELLRYCYGKLRSKSEGRLVRYLFKVPGWRRKRERSFRQLLRSNPGILFVCYGNICRSPFAEKYALRMLKDNGCSGIGVRSAGTYPVENRPSPAVAQLAGERFGIDLREHSSTVLNSALVCWAGVVVCMDFRNYDELRRTYPELRSKLFLLAPFAPGSTNFQIADPWGESASEFQNCYLQIVASLDGMLNRDLLAGFQEPNPTASGGTVQNRGLAAEASSLRQVVQAK